MPEKIMPLLANITSGKSYKAHKYGLDHAERPYIDYGEDNIIWQETAKPAPHSTHCFFVVNICFLLFSIVF